jgi:hypothetical protein
MKARNGIEFVVDGALPEDAGGSPASHVLKSAPSQRPGKLVPPSACTSAAPHPWVTRTELTTATAGAG